jgi:HSP20 family protein
MFTEREIERLFKPLEKNGKVNRYPLTDISEDTVSGELVISVAVSGFEKEEISIEKTGKELIIRGDKDFKVDENLKYYQKHISENSFERVIVLNDIFVGGEISAEIKNGILTIIITPVKPKQTFVEIH